jgi:hypothetical protein
MKLLHLGELSRYGISGQLNGFGWEQKELTVNSTRHDVLLSPTKVPIAQKGNNGTGSKKSKARFVISSHNNV